MDPWQQHLARQADGIDAEALQRAMTLHGISTPEGGMEHFRAALGEMVNRFVRFAAPHPAPPADSVLEDAANGMAAEYQRWIDFFHKGNGDYNDFLRIELHHDAARKQGGSHDPR